jgi:hypothetical protein
MTTDQKRPAREALAENLDQAEWSWIKPHADRDRVIVVAGELVLLDVAVSVAENEAARIDAWITAGKLSKPGREQLASWDATPTRKFMCLVVDPYVLIQDIPHNPSGTLH